MNLINIFLSIVLLSACVFQLGMGSPQDRFDLILGNSYQQTNGQANITPDGGFLISGSHFEGTDIEFLMLAKLSSKGELEWAKRVGRPLDSYGQEAHPTPDGGVIGLVSLAHYIYQTKYISALKFDSNLNFEWGAMIGAAHKHDYARGLVLSNDGGFVIAGHTYNEGVGKDDVVLAKLNSLGSPEWIKILGGPDIDYTRRIINLKDGGYLVCGHTESFSSDYDIFLIRFNSLGEVIWEKRFGDYSERELCWGLAESEIGGFLYIGGSSDGFQIQNSRDALVAKLTGQGQLVWIKLLGGINQTEVRDLILTSQNEILIVGQTNGFGAGSFDFFLSKLDQAGNLLFT